MDLPVVFRYQKALDEFRREGREPPLLKRMSELISLLDLTTTLNSSLSREEILEAALLIVMGELQSSRGVLYVRAGSRECRLGASRGLSAPAPDPVSLELCGDGGVVSRTSGRHGHLFEALGLELLCPVLKADREVAVIGVGPKPDGREYSEADAAFLQSVAACAATPIENGLIHRELKSVNRRLSVKVFQLNSLFDISRELTTSFDEETIKSLTVTTLMGQLMVSRCCLFLRGAGGLVLAHRRGVPGGERSVIPDHDAQKVLEALARPTAVEELPPGPLRERLLRSRLDLAAPVFLGGRVEGLVAVGSRASGEAFTEEDRDFILTLGRQALTALESVRLHRVQVEKQRQDRELQIARQIQTSLFPEGCPAVEGFEVAAVSQPCHQVGGDHYDFISLPDGRLALAIADVSGKSTPASILMASVHASLRALAGTAPPALLAKRLNTFLMESTQANKYVTMVYAELDPERRRLSYVNAGHVPPYLLRADGTLERLESGGTAVGLIGETEYEAAEVELRVGDVLAMLTDGVTEALSPGDVEFGDERAVDVLRAVAGASPEETIRRLVDAVREWTGEGGVSDDLTALVLRAV